MDAMATAGEEQATGVEEINKSMADMDGLTQKNSVMIQEVATASEAMKNEAEALDQQLSFFKTCEDSEAKIGVDIAQYPVTNSGSSRPFKKAA